MGSLSEKYSYVSVTLSVLLEGHKIKTCKWSMPMAGFISHFITDPPNTGIWVM